MPAKLSGLSLQFELERPLSKVLVSGTVEEPQFMLFLQGFEQPNAVEWSMALHLRSEGSMIFLTV